MSTDLNLKQQRFVDEYLIDLNGKQAAIRAGYSPRTAEMQGSRLLSKDKVKAEVARRNKKRAKKFEISADKVLQEIATIAMHTVEEGGFVDTGHKLKALEQLGKHLKLYTDKVEVGGELDFKGITVNLVKHKRVK